MVSENRYISVHIKRTAGNSLRKFYSDLYGPDNVIYFNDTTERFYRSNEDINFRANPAFVYVVKNVLLKSSVGKELLKRLMKSKSIHPNEIPEDKLSETDFRVLHGHFQADRFDPNLFRAKLVTVLREPLERVISHYSLLQQMSLTGNSFPETWFDPSMSLEDFALHSDMTNYQSGVLQNVPLNNFDIVGTTDNMDCYCRHFEPSGRISVPRINQSAREVSPLRPGFVEEFRRRNNLDYQLYEQALHRK